MGGGDVNVEAVDSAYAQRRAAACVPPPLLSDSYKAGHFLQYPPANKMVAYGEFRRPYERDGTDTRLVVYGLRHILDTHVCRRWTAEDVERADAFFRTYQAPAYTPMKYPKELFMKIVNQNDGYFPVRIEALAEGSCINARVPVYQITTTGEFAHLCTYLETLLTMVWYPCTVATLSRRCRDVIEAAFERSAEGGAKHPLVSSRLHDFGFRGCCTVEQSILGASAHLLSFEGTDTMSAAYYVQYGLNDGQPVAQSIPASEHSVMTSWPTELDAMRNMVEQNGDGLFSVVMDSYDYSAALSKVIPAIADQKIKSGGSIVLRPDSGDPVESVIMGLEAADKTFGSDKNSKGYKVLRKAGVIQGDGMDLQSIKEVLEAILDAGFSAENVIFGMGGGLLQKLNRDTMSFATKLSHIEYEDGSKHDKMKSPTEDHSKASFPGILGVKMVGNVPTAFPIEEVSPSENMLRVVYDNGPILPSEKETFDEMRKRVQATWDMLPKTAKSISESLKRKIKTVAKELGRA